MSDGTPPETIPDDDDGGWWIRHDVLIASELRDYQDDDDVDRDRLGRITDEMVAEGVLEEREFQGERYVRGASRAALLKAWARYKTLDVTDRARRFLGREVDDE